MTKSKDAEPLLRRGLIKSYRDQVVEPDISPDESILEKNFGCLGLLLFLVVFLLVFIINVFPDYPLLFVIAGYGFFLLFGLQFAFIIFSYAYPIILGAFWYRNL